MKTSIVTMISILVFSSMGFSKQNACKQAYKTVEGCVGCCRLVYSDENQNKATVILNSSCKANRTESESVEIFDTVARTYDPEMLGTRFAPVSMKAELLKLLCDARFNENQSNYKKECLKECAK